MTSSTAAVVAAQTALPDTPCKCAFITAAREFFKHAATAAAASSRPARKFTHMPATSSGNLKPLIFIKLYRQILLKFAEYSVKLKII